MGTGPLARATRSTAAVYALGEGHHVTVLIDASETGGAFDLVEVMAGPGDLASPHRHGFAEWFHVLDGTLGLATADQEGERPPVRVEAGGTYVVPPGIVHSLHNPTAEPIRFIAVGLPAVTSTFVAKAGVRVRDAQTPPTVPPLPADALADLAVNFGIDLRKESN